MRSIFREKYQKNTFEPPKEPVDKGKTPAFADVHPIWLRIVNDVRAIIQRQNRYVYIPDLRSKIFSNP